MRSGYSLTVSWTTVQGAWHCVSLQPQAVTPSFGCWGLRTDRGGRAECSTLLLSKRGHTPCLASSTGTRRSPGSSRSHGGDRSTVRRQSCTTCEQPRLNAEWRRQVVNFYSFALDQSRSEHPLEQMSEAIRSDDRQRRERVMAERVEADEQEKRGRSA